MAKDNQMPLIPKLRFPAFRGASEWEGKKLGDLSKVLRGGSPRPIDNYITLKINGLNWLKIADVNKNSKYVTCTKERVLVTALSKTREVSPGDLIMSNSMSFGRPYILKIKACIHDGWIAVTEIDEQANRDYLYYLILSPESQVYFSNNAAGGGVQNLNADIIKLLPVLIPEDSEQQKIADCLSSIDELITAHSQKHEALKAHKNGLMQQLFPAEGETVPKLRFPEFGEDLKAVGFAELGEIKIGLTHKPEYIKSGKPFLSSKNISNGYIDFENIKYISEEKFSSMPESTKPKVGDILFTRVGSNLGNPIILEEDREFGIFVSLGIFRVNRKVSNYYIKHWMDSDYFWEQVKQKVAGGAKDNLNTTWLKEFKLSIPLFSEQQKIANCLSSIDDLITAQAQKIDSLKAHKKGLMQQLFPAADETNG